MLVTIFPYSVLYINCKTDSSNNTEKYFPKFFDNPYSSGGDFFGAIFFGKISMVKGFSGSGCEVTDPDGVGHFA